MRPKRWFRLRARRVAALITVIVGLLSQLSGCGGSDSGRSGNASDGRSRSFRRAASEGRLLYQQHCIQCHQADGQGQGRVYPPLAGADYLLQDWDRAACIVRYGLQGPIWVNGQDYNLKMIGYPQLRTRQIAQLLTYIGNSWGNEAGLIPASQVAQALDSCSGMVQGVPKDEGQSPESR